MKHKIDFNKILIIFLLLSPFIDLFTSLMVHANISITIGMISRLIFLIFVIFYTIKNFKYKYFYILYLFLIAIYLGIYLLLLKNNLFYEISWVLKIFYFPIMLISLFFINKDNPIKMNQKYLIIYVFTYIFLILFGNLSGHAFNSYEITKLGKLGFFNAANEISCIIAILIPFLFYYFLKKINVFNIILLLIFIVTIFSIGTKTPLISLGLTIITYGIFYLIKLFKRNKKLSLILILSFGIITILVSFLMIPKTPIYKNTIVHLEYLHIKHLKDLLTFKNIDHFFLGSRLKFLSNVAIVFNNSSFLNKLFGIGYSIVNKTIEMDFFDVFYHLGVIGFTLFIIPIITVFRYGFKKNDLNLPIILTIIMCFLTSFVVGHVLVAPSVSFLVCLIFVVKPKRCAKKKLLFTANDMCIGGIESALVNLLDKIDYNKYSVTLLLEQKKGPLVKKINNNVKIIDYKLSHNKNIFIRKLINLYKRIIFTIVNYNQYNFSCCFATYSLLGSKISRIASKNNSIYIHGDYVLDFNDIDKVKDFFNHRAILKFKKVIFVSNESRKRLISIYPKLEKTSIVINNFFDYKKIVNDSNKKINLKKKSKEKLFVFVGRLEEKTKRISIIINLIDYLNKKGINSSLWIIGDGIDKNFYRSLIKSKKLEKKIILVGAKINPYPYMKKADYIILTSKNEGFPVVFLEAIVMSKKIISTLDISDDYFSLKNRFGFIVNEKTIFTDVEKIIKHDNLKYESVDFDFLERKKIKVLEEIFEGEKND